MNYMCRFGSLGNSSTALGSSDPGGNGRPKLPLDCRDFFFVPAVLSSILALFFLLPRFHSLSYFILAVPMHKCSEEHSCMSSSFRIAILIGPGFFREAKWSWL